MLFVGVGLLIVDYAVDVSDNCFAGLSFEDWVLFLGISLLAWFPCIVASLLVLIIPVYTLEFAKVDPRFSRSLHHPTTTFMWAAFLPLIHALVRGDDDRCRGDDELHNVILMYLTFRGLVFGQNMLLRSISYTYYAQSLSRMQTMLEADTIMTSLLSYIRRGTVDTDNFLASHQTPTAKNRTLRIVSLSRYRRHISREINSDQAADIANEGPNSIELQTSPSSPIMGQPVESSPTTPAAAFEESNADNPDKHDDLTIKKKAFANARNFIVHMRKKANRVVNGRAVRFSATSISAVAEEIGTEIYDGLIKRRRDDDEIPSPYLKPNRAPIEEVDEKDYDSSRDCPSPKTPPIHGGDEAVDAPWIDRPKTKSNLPRLSWEDFRRAYADGSVNGTEEQANQFACSCISLFDDIGDHNTRVSKNQLIKVLGGILSERNALVVNSFDSQHALRHLDSLLFIIVMFISCIAWLLIWDVDLNKLFITFSTVVLAFAFFFGATAREFFEGVIFVFIRHPYDVGDKVQVDGEKYIVEEIQLLSTVMKHWTGAVNYIPHNMLNTTRIVNLYRSGPMTHDLTFFVNAMTPEEKMIALEERMAAFFRETMKKQLDGEEWRLSYNRIDELNRLVCHLWIKQRTNFQDGARLWRNRTRILRALRIAMADIGITYALPVQPVQFQKNHEDPDGDTLPGFDFISSHATKKKFKKSI